MPNTYDDGTIYSVLLAVHNDTKTAIFATFCKFSTIFLSYIEINS